MIDDASKFEAKVLFDDKCRCEFGLFTKSVEYLRDLVLVNLEETSAQYFLNHLTWDLSFSDSK